MLTAQRKIHLLARLAETGRIVARDEAQTMSLSEDTIRRDLRDLAAEGKLLRVHGGALPLSPTHLPLADRRNLQSDANLPGTLVATIVTHSPVIAAALEPFAGIDVLLIGGRLFRHSMVAVGSIAAEGFASLRADLCFVGVTGLHPDTGLTTGDAEEAAIKRRIIAQSGEVIVLATPDKIGSTSPFRIAPLAQLATLISIGPRPAGIPAGIGHISA